MSRGIIVDTWGPGHRGAMLPSDHSSTEISALAGLIVKALSFIDYLEGRVSQKYLDKNGAYSNIKYNVAPDGKIKGLFDKFGKLNGKYDHYVKYPEDCLSAEEQSSDEYQFINAHSLSDYDLLDLCQKCLVEATDRIKEYRKLIASLYEEPLPDEVPISINFVKDNKLPAPADEEIKRVKQSLPISVAQELTNTLKITDREMATILTISIRTYHRLKLNGSLNPVASERLLLLKDLVETGLEIFEDQETFNKWLRLPARELSNQTPLSSLDTATGFTLVNAILGRIEYGVYS